MCALESGIINPTNAGITCDGYGEDALLNRSNIQIPGTKTTTGCMAGDFCYETKDWQYAWGVVAYVHRLKNGTKPYYLLHSNSMDSNDNTIKCYDFLVSGSCQKICGSNGCTVN